MGNAATCSLVDVADMVSVTQTNGPTLEFVQPIFASQVKKLHPGNWLLHYVSAHDPTLGRQHGRMIMLQGREELQAGEIYFLFPIPTHFKKQLFGPNNSGGQFHSKSSKMGSAAGATPPRILADPSPVPTSQHQPFVFNPDASTARGLRGQETTPAFFKEGSNVPQQCCVRPSRPRKKCSSRHKIHVCDWQPTLVTIQEV